MATAELIPLVFAALVGYLLGSIPFPYLAVRLKTGEDLRHVHTGNVGVMNSMSVLGRYLGFGVALMEFGKGFSAAWLGLQIADEYGAWIALVLAVVGANWPVWLRFSGGRGNTTLAGGLLLLSPVLLVVSFSAFWIGRALLGNNFIAARVNMVLMPIYYGMYAWWLGKSVEATLLFVSTGAILALIFRVKHSRETDDHMALQEAGRLPGHHKDA